jgi:hypothetical protein
MFLQKKINSNFENNGDGTMGAYALKIKSVRMN